jgi:hypothetical protein
MKNVLKVAILAAGIFSFAQSNAQTQEPTVGHKIGNTAKKVGHKTAHVAVSGTAAITDKKYEGKCGPQGQTVYINKNSQYFYVGKKGQRVYLKKSQLMDKKMRG